MKNDDESETYDIKDVMRVLGLSRGTVYNLRKDPSKKFPKALPLGVDRQLFDKRQIDAYRLYGALWEVKLQLA